MTWPRTVLRCHGHSTPGDKKRPYYFQFADTTSLESLTNLGRPEKSLLLRAPLAKEAGGLGLCEHPVFTSANDPGYQSLLAAIHASAEKLRQHKRFDMPGFRPNEHYVRELQRFAILPDDLNAADSIDIYSTDRAYWESFWYLPPAQFPPSERN
jgi:hypothetical protein